MAVYQYDLSYSMSYGALPFLKYDTEMRSSEAVGIVALYLTAYNVHK